MRISDEHRELIAQLQPLDLPETPCTECAADVDGLTIVHTDDCAVSKDVESICAKDRDWFDSHPGADFFYREISWGESVQLLSARSDLPRLQPGDTLSAAGKVRVERLLEGVRIRRFDEIYFVLGGSS